MQVRVLPEALSPLLSVVADPHALVYEIGCPGSTPGGEATSLSSSGQGPQRLTPGTRVRLPRGTPRPSSCRMQAPASEAAGLGSTPGEGADAVRTASGAAMVQEQNARAPLSRSGCDSRSPLLARCAPRRKVGLIRPTATVRLRPQRPHRGRRVARRAALVRKTGVRIPPPAPRGARRLVMAPVPHTGEESSILSLRTVTPT